MSDESLMNPDHLKSELRDMEQLAINEENLVQELKADYDRVIDMIRESHDAGQDTVLTPAQTRELIETMANFNHTLFVFSRHRKFYIRVYKNLLSDRRWFIAAKYLRFLKK